MEMNNNKSTKDKVSIMNELVNAFYPVLSQSNTSLVVDMNDATSKEGTKNLMNLDDLVDKWEARLDLTKVEKAQFKRHIVAKPTYIEGGAIGEFGNDYIEYGTGGSFVTDNLNNPFWYNAQKSGKCDNGQAKAIKAALKGLVDELIISNGDYKDNRNRDYLGWWCAQQVINPCEKTKTIVLLTGEGGSGKSTLAQAIMCAVGAKTSTIIGSTSDLEGDHSSDLLVGSTFVAVDETYSKSPKLTQKLKNWATSSRIIVNAKGLRQTEQNFCGDFMLLSNHKEDAVKLEDTNRKFVVLTALKSKRGVECATVLGEAIENGRIKVDGTWVDINSESVAVGIYWACKEFMEKGIKRGFECGKAFDTTEKENMEKVIKAGDGSEYVKESITSAILKMIEENDGVVSIKGVQKRCTSEYQLSEKEVTSKAVMGVFVHSKMVSSKMVHLLSKANRIKDKELRKVFIDKKYTESPDVFVTKKKHLELIKEVGERKVMQEVRYILIDKEMKVTEWGNPNDSF